MRKKNCIVSTLNIAYDILRKQEFKAESDMLFICSWNMLLVAIIGMIILNILFPDANLWTFYYWC